MPSVYPPVDQAAAVPSLRTLGTGAQQALPGNTSSLPPSGAAGGDLTGTYPNPTLAASGVSAATYGDSTHVAQVALDAKGRATSASNVAIAFPADAVTSVFGLTGAISVDTIGGVVWTVVVKGGDTSRSNTTTLTADPDLHFSTVSGAIYEFEAIIIETCPSGTPDLKYGFGEDTTPRGAFVVTVFSTADNPLVAAGQTNGTSSTLAMASSISALAGLIRGTFRGNGGTFNYYWAQNTLDASNAVTVKAGSVLRYRRIL